MAAFSFTPNHFDAAIFDLDDVITDTATVHKVLGGNCSMNTCRSLPAQPGEDHIRLTNEDYRRFIDGKPRYDEVRSFLVARGIRAQEANIHQLVDRKSRYFRTLLERESVHVFHGSVALANELKAGGQRIAIVSASRNYHAVLVAAGLGDMFDARVDGVVADELGLHGKPNLVVSLEAAWRLEVQPARAVVVEDARAGVEAARRGGFALAVGVDRTGHGDELRDRGADVPVADLGEIIVRCAADRGVET